MARNARSALWPRMATGTTWWSGASVASATAAAIAAASAIGDTLQKRCRTPQPWLGVTGSMAPMLVNALTGICLMRHVDDVSFAVLAEPARREILDLLR